MANKAKTYKLKYSIGDNSDSNYKEKFKLLKDCIKYEVKSTKRMLIENKKSLDFNSCALNIETLSTLAWIQAEIESIEENNSLL